MNQNKLDRIREMAEEASIMSKKKKLEIKGKEEKKKTSPKDINAELQNMQGNADDVIEDMSDGDNEDKGKDNSGDDSGDDSEDKMGKNVTPPVEFREKVIKYLKIDDLVFEKKEWLKKLMVEQIQTTKNEIK